MILRSAGTEKH